MKNLFATIEYVAEKILEAITGHKNDEQAHPNLSEQINVLSTDRGYLTSKDINNMDDLKFNGKFIFSGEIEGITASWHVDVTSGINTHLQIATTTWDNTGNTRGITLTRIFCDGKWSGWKQLATTTKTDILVTPRPNRTIIYNNSYKDSMGFVVDFRVKNTDDSDIPVGYDAWFDGLPYIGDVYKPISAICLNASGAYVGECVGYRWGSGVYLYPSVVCKSIAVYDYVGGDK